MMMKIMKQTAQLLLLLQLALDGAFCETYSITLGDMIRDCKSHLEFDIKFPDESALHRAVLHLSTRSVIPNQFLVTMETSSSKLPCLYHGVNNMTKETVFAHVSEGVLRSVFQSGGRWYRTKRSILSTEPAAALPVAVDDHGAAVRIYTDSSSLLGTRQRFVQLVEPSSGSAANGHSRRKRSLKLESFNDAAVRKVLELVVVADSGYVAKFGGQTAAISRILDIVNYMNGVYQVFGLRIILAQAVALTTNPFNVNQSSESVLRDFSVYKVLNINVRFDSAILLVSTPMNNVLSSGITNQITATGWIRGLCLSFDSSGIVSDLGITIQTAWLMAHAIGFQLGFNNVEDVSSCYCPASNGCVMSNALSSDYSFMLAKWDNCSVSNWRTQVDEIWRSCLKDAPEIYQNSTTARCGNGITEIGEQCDCGPTLTCMSSCCEPSTCQFKPGAECASGACCNNSTCRLKIRGQVCRDTDGPCDVAETCDGSTEWCPSDDRVADGVQCSNTSYCYNGECKSSLNQCQQLFGSSAKVGDASCFTTFNVLTDYGFCHKTLRTINATQVSYNLQACSINDAPCGMLHCSVPVVPSVGLTYNLGSTTCSNLWFIDTSTSGLRSPAMVPDGVSCGSQSMCVNSSCQLLSRFACTNCPNCNGNGVLTRSKLCYCKPGFAPPDCSSSGCGGSTSSPYDCDCDLTTRPRTTTSTTTTTTSTTRTTSLKASSTGTSPTTSTMAVTSSLMSTSTGLSRLNAASSTSTMASFLTLSSSEISSKSSTLSLLPNEYTKVDPDVGMMTLLVAALVPILGCALIAIVLAVTVKQCMKHKKEAQKSKLQSEKPESVYAKPKPISEVEEIYEDIYENQEPVIVPQDRDGNPYIDVDRY